MSRLFPASMPDWGRGLIKTVAAGFVCGVIGYGVGHVAADWFPGLEPDLSGVRWADVVAGLLAAILLVACIGTLVSTLNRARLGRLLALEGPAGNEEVRSVRLQALIMALSAIILPLPMILTAVDVRTSGALALIVVLLAIHTALNFKLYGTVDELFRRVAIEAGAVTFWFGQGLLFLCAAAERLAVIPPITSWDIYVVLMGVYLIVSMIVTLRRGLA